jgi:hypothetical protein
MMIPWLGMKSLLFLGVEGPKAIAFKIYPNPSSKYFIIQATQGVVLVYILCDIKSTKLQNYPANTRTIDARGLSRAVYMLALETSRADTLYQKLVNK